MEEEIESTFLLQKCAQGNSDEKSQASPWGCLSHIALDLISTCQKCSLGGWAVEHSGAAKSRGLGVTPGMVAIFWVGRVFVG